MRKSGLSFLHNILAIVLMRVPGVYVTSKLFPGNASPDGTGYRGRLTAIGRDLPNRLWSHTAQINACSGGGVRYGSEKSLPNR